MLHVPLSICVTCQQQFAIRMRSSFLHFDRQPFRCAHPNPPHPTRCHRFNFHPFSLLLSFSIPFKGPPLHIHPRPPHQRVKMESMPFANVMQTLLPNIQPCAKPLWNNAENHFAVHCAFEWRGNPPSTSGVI